MKRLTLRLAGLRSVRNDKTDLCMMARLVMMNMDMDKWYEMIKMNLE